MQHALLERDQLVDVMAVAGRGGRDMYVLARPSRGMHTEAAVQAREKPPHGWPWMAALEASSEGLHGIAHGRQPWTSTLSP